MFSNYIEQAARLYEEMDGVLICDKYGYIEYAKWIDNRHFLNLEVAGNHITKVYPELTPETSTILLAISKGQGRYDERQVLTAFNGEKIDIITTTLPIYSNNEIIGAMAASVYFDKYTGGSKKSLKSSSTLYSLSDIVTQNSTMLALKERCRVIAPNDSPVLLYGETGTGKELFAQSLHTSSARHSKPFISQNCAAIPFSLLEGLFFGSEKGSFTGAETRKGLFELADGGTLFLDEINSMDISMQAKLLKVIEEQKLRRLGGTKDIHFNVRIVCAMNENPFEVLKEGKIREDLYYRISVVRIDILPLRSRKNDVEVLTHHFINHFNHKMNKKVTGVSDLVKMAFENYEWFGNVRELRNTIESAFNIVKGDTINMTDIPEFVSYKNEVSTQSPTAPPIISGDSFSLTQALTDYEKSLIQTALSSSKNISTAAKVLKISRQSLTYKIEKYNLDF